MQLPKRVERLLLGGVAVAIVAWGALMADPPSYTPSPYWQQKAKEREESVKKGQTPTDKDKENKDRAKEREALRALLKAKIEGEKRFHTNLAGVYTFPGVVIGGESGGWEGSDNVYNITENIGVSAEVIFNSSMKFPIQKEQIVRRVEEIFKTGGIHPQAVLQLGKPPLPLFNVVLMIQPIDKGYALLLSGNLLEEVDVKRVHLTQGAWQAITWQREDLLVVATEDAPHQINKAIDELAFQFVKVYRHFGYLRNNR